MLNQDRIAELEALYISWSGNTSAPSNFSRLVNIADALFKSQMPNLPEYEDMSANCKQAYDFALTEQVLFYEENGTNASSRQVVTAIRAGDASENYSAPKGTDQKICDEANAFLDNAECNFKSRAIIGYRGSNNCDCECV